MTESLAKSLPAVCLVGSSGLGDTGFCPYHMQTHCFAIEATVTFGMQSKGWLFEDQDSEKFESIA